MAHISDEDFVHRLLGATLEDKIDWQPTAQSNHYSATFGGKWTVEVFTELRGLAAQTGQPIYTYVFGLRDASGELLLRIDSDQNARIEELHELARRRALKVDEAVADFLKELDEEPQP